MVTGLDLKKLFNDKIDNSYSDYVSDDKMQRAFDNSFLRVIENKYRGLDTQKEFDELSELMVIDRNIIVNNNRFRTKPIPLASVTGTTFTFSAEHNLIAGNTFTVQNTGTANDGQTFTVASVTNANEVETTVAGVPVTSNTGGVVSQDIMLEDYLHLLAMKVDIYSTLSDDVNTIYKIYSGTPGIIEFFRPTNMRSRDRVYGNVLNLTSGFGYVKQVSEFKYEVYSDESLSTPITVGAIPSPLPYVYGSKVHSNWAKYLQSDRRISRSGIPTLSEPRFNQDKNFFLIHPQNMTTLSVSIDYIRKPNISILVTDNSLDLSLFYSETLLNRLTDEAVKMFYQEVRDPNQYQVADREMLDNP
jgi:hypothetical protein